MRLEIEIIEALTDLRRQMKFSTAQGIKDTEFLAGRIFSLEYVLAQREVQSIRSES